MSDDLIKRQDAIDAIEELISARREWLSDNARDEIKGLDAAICEIQNLPAADVPDRKVGKWIIHPEVKNIYGGTCIECSECGEKYVVRHIEDEKFCRNCGADMRGEEDA